MDCDETRMCTLKPYQLALPPVYAFMIVKQMNNGFGHNTSQQIEVSREIPASDDLTGLASYDRESFMSFDTSPVPKYVFARN